MDNLVYNQTSHQEVYMSERLNVGTIVTLTSDIPTLKLSSQALRRVSCVWLGTTVWRGRNSVLLVQLVSSRTRPDSLSVTNVLLATTPLTLLPASVSSVMLGSSTRMR